MNKPLLIYMPQENVNDDHILIVKWLFDSGTKIKKDVVIAELETSKATFELRSEAEGFLYYAIGEDTQIPVGELIACITDVPGMPDVLNEKRNNKTEIADIDSSRVTLKARKMIEEFNLALDDFKGIKKIKVADVEEFLEKKSHNKDEGLNPKIEGKIKPVELSNSKKREIFLLSKNNAIITSTVKITADLKKIGEKWDADFSLFEKMTISVSRLLKEFPFVNAFYEDGKSMCYQNVDIGFAINIGDKGLMVPVLRNADQMKPNEIVEGVRELTLQYVRQELAPVNLGGSTFTITDLSAYDVVDFIPVVNYRQAAILGLAACQPDTDWFYLILTFDHRLVEGAMAAGFLKRLREVLYFGL